VLATDNGVEAGFIEKLNAHLADTLAQVCRFFNSSDELARAPDKTPQNSIVYTQDLSEVLAQTQAKRALEIAAAGIIIFY
jgi:predicted ATPase with chaperone activity